MNPFDMVKNLTGIQSQINATQEKLGQLKTTGSSGGNMVQITINGNFEIIDIKLDPICVDNRDVSMLQDLIMAAHHAALDKMIEEMKGPLDSVMANLNIPGMSV